MGKEWMALGLAGALALTLTACGQTDKTTRTTTDAGMNSRTVAGANDMMSDMKADGRYTADARGRVTDRDTGMTQWEEIGRSIQDSWDDLMQDGKQAMDDVADGARDMTGTTK